MAFTKSCSIDSRNEQSPTCEMVHETNKAHFSSEISCPTDSCLTQLVRHWPKDPEILVSNPTGGNFWRNVFCSSVYKDLSDNLTETPIVKNSIIVTIFPKIHGNVTGKGVEIQPLSLPIPTNMPMSNADCSNCLIQNYQTFKQTLIERQKVFWGKDRNIKH